MRHPVGCMNKPTPQNEKSEASAKDEIIVKFGLDVHASQITVCRQVGDLSPQPPQKMTWAQALAFIKNSGGPSRRLHTCYEAGPFGYGLHRTLEEMGVRNIVVTPERLDPRCKRVKTDKRDSQTLAMRLDSHLKGNTSVLAKVWVPTPEQEQKRLFARQRQARCKEKQRALKRARSLLLGQGIGTPDNWWREQHWKMLEKHLPDWLAEQVGYWRKTAIQMDADIKAMEEKLQAAGERRRRPKGLGALSLEVLSREVLDWKRFKNRRQVSSYTGLCPSEYSSGETRSQGSVTKHGNPRVRHILVEAGWRLLKWQPRYKPLKAVGQATSKSARKKAIVAVARRFAVDLWRIETGQCRGEELGLVMVEGRED
jgi:transposase